MPTILMTFDLEGADGTARELGYAALVPHGLSRVSRNKNIRLPYSSVMGFTTLGKNAATIRDALATILENATNYPVARIFVAVVDDWACTGNRDDDLMLRELEELIRRFGEE